MMLIRKLKNELALERIGLDRTGYRLSFTNLKLEAEDKIRPSQSKISSTPNLLLTTLCSFAFHKNILLLFYFYTLLILTRLFPFGILLPFHTNHPHWTIVGHALQSIQSLDNQLAIPTSWIIFLFFLIFPFHYNKNWVCSYIPIHMISPSNWL